MQNINKFNLNFSFFELQKNILSLNGADRNYSKKLIYTCIFFETLSQNFINN